MAGPNVGYATLSVIPSAQGFEGKLRQQLSGPVAGASSKAGDDSGKSFLSGLSGALKGGALAAGIAAGALIAQGVGSALEQGTANDKFAAQLGLPPERAEELGKVAGDLYVNAYGDSLTGVNDALKGVLQSGLVPEDVDNGTLEALTAKALDLASAFDVDVNQATATAGQLMRTGLAANADEAFDIITRGFQQGADKSGDLLDTLNEYGTQFRKVGIDGAAATGLLVQGLKAGARDSDIVADSIKEFSIRAVDGSELTAKGFQAVGLDAKKMSQAIAKGGPAANDALDETLDRLRAMPDPVKRSQTAIALFGTQAEDLGDALFALDPSEATRGLGDLAGAAERMGDALNDNAASKIESFKRGALQGLTDFIGGSVIPGIEGLADTFSEEGLGGVIDKITTGISTFAPLLGDQLKQWGAQLVGWVGPQIVPFLENLAGFVGQGVAWILDPGVGLLAEGAAKLVPALIDWVVDEAIPGLVEVLPEMAGAFADWIRDDGFDAFKAAGARLGRAVWSGFRESLQEFFTGAFGDSFDFLGGAELGFDTDFLPSFDLDKILEGFGRASGGSVSAGRPYIVGDRHGMRDAELFVPESSGTILPRVPQEWPDTTRGTGGFVQQLIINNPIPETPSESVLTAGRRVAALRVA